MAFPSMPPPPPPGYGYGYPPGAGFLPPGPDTAAPARRSPTWVTVAVAVVLTAVASVLATHIVDGPRNSFALSNDPPTGGVVVATTNGSQSALESDLKSASIAEESFATDNNGEFSGDIVSSSSGPNDPLVSQGLQVQPADTITAKVFTVGTTQNYCLTGVSTATPVTWYLSSIDDTLTTVRPANC